MADKNTVDTIQLYNDQLEQVSLALQASCLEASDRQQLEQLQQNLIQLLELELDQLQALKSSASDSVQQPPAGSNNHTKTEEEMRIEEELALFKTEIEQLDPKPSDSNENTHTSANEVSDESSNEDSSRNLSGGSTYELEEIESKDSVYSLLSRNLSDYKGFTKAWTTEEVNKLEGAAVCAPYIEEWGGHTYHNAVVMSIGNPDTGELNLDYPEVVVLFSQPTSRAMLPCRYFMSGVCRFNDACQYSHGSLVAVHLLRPYMFPDTSSLEVGSKVLCRHALSSSADSIIPLWHPGVVDAILHADEVVSVQCTPCSSVVECALDKIVPLPSESQSLQLSPSDAIPIEPGNSSTSFEKGDLLSETFTDDEPPSEWLLNPTAVSALGEWEKHTKGIGSRLMSLMGYVAGAGLGRRQEGRVEPVPAYLYPPGVSLDRCMELREKSGGEDLLQVEKRLKKDQLREEKRIKREEERISANTSVFDIINNQLAGPGAKKDRMKASKDSVNVDKSHLKTNSSKELNLKGYQLGQRSAQLEREIVHLSQSMARQAPRDKEAAGSIQKRIDEKKQELELTNRAQARVSSEQNSRREKKKYDVF